MADKNPASEYLKDENKKNYFKAKSQAIELIADLRKKLNDYLVPKGDLVQYEINELNGFDCQFKIINKVLVEINNTNVTYHNFKSDKDLNELSDNQKDDIKQTATKIIRLVTQAQSFKAQIK